MGWIFCNFHTRTSSRIGNTIMKHLKWINFNELFKVFLFLFALNYSLNSLKFLLKNTSSDWSGELELKLANRKSRCFLYALEFRQFYHRIFFFSSLQLNSKLFSREDLLHSTTFSNRLWYFLHPKMWNTEKNCMKKLDCTGAIAFVVRAPFSSDSSCYFNIFFSALLFVVSNNRET